VHVHAATVDVPAIFLTRTWLALRLSITIGKTLLKPNFLWPDIGSPIVSLVRWSIEVNADWCRRARAAAVCRGFTSFIFWLLPIGAWHVAHVFLGCKTTHASQLIATHLTAPACRMVCASGSG
jgi:hypothetical protein